MRQNFGSRGTHTCTYVHTRMHVHTRTHHGIWLKMRPQDLGLRHTLARPPSPGPAPPRPYPLTHAPSGPPSGAPKLSSLSGELAVWKVLQDHECPVLSRAEEGRPCCCVQFDGLYRAGACLEVVDTRLCL